MDHEGCRLLPKEMADYIFKAYVFLTERRHSLHVDALRHRCVSGDGCQQERPQFRYRHEEFIRLRLLQHVQFQASPSRPDGSDTSRVRRLSVLRTVPDMIRARRRFPTTFKRQQEAIGIRFTAAYVVEADDAIQRPFLPFCKML